MPEWATVPGARQAKRWTITWWGTQEECKRAKRGEDVELTPPAWEETWMGYLVYGRERTKGGRLHYQMYLETKDKITLGSAKPGRRPPRAL